MIIQFYSIWLVVFSIWVNSCLPNEKKQNSPIQGSISNQAKEKNIKSDNLIITTPGKDGIDDHKVVQSGKPQTVRNRLLSVRSGSPSQVFIDTTQLQVITPGANGIPFALSYNITKSDYLVQHDDTTHAPNVKTAHYPKPVSALPNRFKDNAVYNIQYIDVDQGLPSSYITSTLQDTNDNIWIGTEGGGVSRYDGTTFTTFTEQEGLVNNAVYSILEDNSGNFWFGTDGGGVSRFDGDKFISFTENEGLVNNSIHAIAQDQVGNVWLASWGGGVSRFDGKSFTTFTENEGLVNNFVRSVIEDHAGNIWFATKGGVSRFDGTSFVSYTEANGLGNHGVLSIFEDTQKNIWFGTDGGGVSRFDGISFTTYTTANGLIDNNVYSIQEDRNGMMWFGTGSGASSFDGLFFTSLTEHEGLANNFVRSILADKSGNVWFGTYGGGLSRYGTTHFTLYTENEGMPNNIILSMLEDKKGYLWFGSWGGGVSRYDGTSFTTYSENEGLANDFVRSILEDKNGDLWFGTYGSGISRFDGNSFTLYDETNGLMNNTVFSMLEDQKGDLWFGTYGGGVSRYNGSTFINYSEQDGLLDNIIFSMLEDKRGNLWFGTVKGLSRFDGSKFTSYTTREGLVNNSVYSIFEDSIGNIWLGTGGGISILTQEDLTNENKSIFKNFTIENGLPNNIVMSFIQDESGRLWIGTEGGIMVLNTPLQMGSELSDYHVITQQEGLKGLVALINSVCMDKQNRIWWGMSKGLTMLDLNTFDIPKGIPSIQFNGVDINGSFVDFRELKETEQTNMGLNSVQYSTIPSFRNYPMDLSLSHDLNHLRFHYSAIEWESPQKIRYQFKLEGLDEDWNELTQESDVEYRNLHHGAYMFKVRAIGASHIWSDTITYPFTIRPAWWLTWWAKVLWIIVLMSVIILIYKGRLKALKLQKRNLLYQVNKQTIELKEQNIEISLKNKELEVLNQEKNKLIGLVAHDLRSPLNAIKGLIYLIQDEDEPIDKEHYMEMITTSTDRMTDMVNRILDVSALESKTLNIRLERIDLVELISRLMINFRIYVKKKKQRLELNLDCDTAVVEIDKNYFIQILENLLSNAIKYSEESTTITISLTCFDKKVQLYMQDQGQGISEKEQKQLFKEFATLSSKTTDGEKATGLGLSIVKKYVEAMNGIIWCESKLGVGTKFILQFKSE